VAGYNFSNISFSLPAASLSLVIPTVGVAKKIFWLLLIGAALFIPFACYLSGAPGTKGPAILLPLFQIGSAAAVYKIRRTTYGRGPYWHLHSLQVCGSLE
jgi:hypothetical protein